MVFFAIFREGFQMLYLDFHILLFSDALKWIIFIYWLCIGDSVWRVNMCLLDGYIINKKIQLRIF